MAFCKNCGKQLEDGVKFCGGCGTAVDGMPTTSSAPMSVTQNTTTIMAKTFRCSGCGEALKIPKNPREVVICPSCRNECVIDGLIKNAEMAAKENINSGVPLTATYTKLHSIIISVLEKEANLPLDFVDKAEVIMEEHYCVPAYCFEYNGEAPFSYEEGKQETRQERGFSGDSETIRTIWEVKWHTERGTASVSGTLFVSGNKKLAPYINEMYIKTDHNQFVDFEYLEFPLDVETLEYDVPQLTAFNEQIKPIVEHQLNKEGKKALNGTQYEGHIPRGGVRGITYTSDFKLSGSRIQKEVTRVFLGLYRVVYKYDDKEYDIWINGDGSNWLYDSPPFDLNRKNEHEQLQKNVAEKEQELKSVPSSNVGCLITGVVAFIIIALICFGTLEEYSIITGIPCIIGAILCYSKIASAKRKAKEYDKKREESNEKIDKAKIELEDFESQVPAILQRFKSQEKALRGIYEKISGNDSAF